MMTDTIPILYCDYWNIFEKGVIGHGTSQNKRPDVVMAVVLPVLLLGRRTYNRGHVKQRADSDVSGKGPARPARIFKA
jgi:hypothetical protein